VDDSFASPAARERCRFRDRFGGLPLSPSLSLPAYAQEKNVNSGILAMAFRNMHALRTELSKYRDTKRGPHKTRTFRNSRTAMRAVELDGARSLGCSFLLLLPYEAANLARLCARETRDRRSFEQPRAATIRTRRRRRVHVHAPSRDSCSLLFMCMVQYMPNTLRDTWRGLIGVCVTRSRKPASPPSVCRSAREMQTSARDCSRFRRYINRMYISRIRDS